MERRLAEFERDCETLLSLQRVSREINFPGLPYSERAFRYSLRSGTRRGQVHVYEIDGELMGYLWIDLAKPNTGGHVRHVQVIEERWGGGLGRAIMEDAIAMCIERGCHAVTLNVTKSNRRAVSLYSRLGFVPVEEDGNRQRMRLDLIGKQ